MNTVVKTAGDSDVTCKISGQTNAHVRVKHLYSANFTVTDRLAGYHHI